MKIVDVILSKGKTGFFFDDQRAIKKHAVPNGASYSGMPITQGFESIRQAGEAISVMLLLEDGQIAHGDCAAVQYSGAGGRDPLFLAKDYIPIIEKYLKPILIGKELHSFRDLAEEIDHYVMPTTGKPLHTAIRYGMTQAILDGVAKSKKRLMAEVVAEEYGTAMTKEEIPIFMQSGDDRYNNVDKMILKEADVLPHGLINNVELKLGKEGELLKKYIAWLRDRVGEISQDAVYQPILHLDVYGTIGMIFDYDMDRMVAYMKELEEAAYPLKLRIEGPMDMEERTAQMEALREMCQRLDAQNIQVEIVADEWCNTFDDIKYFADNGAGHMIQIKTPDLGGINNTIEAVLYCNKKGIGAYQGGTCNETDRSSQVCVHLAMATKPVQILAKPGMGVDEGYMIVFNEMQRILAVRKMRERIE
ncbi:methylaspartate ammonia-lyase [Vallitalea pronyensis]|uniref:methylaspartate ammonia-lyase n=1 Tax=Vallitalea pronyensis TaxID=1348613 RepID=A0A8J8SGP5_9FIRM|nr:methylaspartate ammonia-lyase [Vallitalea pronyensis]QUI22604.1 methylaspartate ammonia-lyase [Vallitalea pronyensis]